MKLIVTTGPSTKENWVIKDLVSLGVDIFRFNTSHGNINELDNLYKWIKEVSSDVHIMIDLSGSKIRVSDKLPYIYKIYNGEEVIFCGEDIYKNKGYAARNSERKVIPLNVSNKELLENTFNEMSMKDDTMKFQVISSFKKGVIAKVQKGGIVRAGKGCNIKEFKREGKSFCEKDIEGLNFAIKNNIEIICQSFVESSYDIDLVLDYIKNNSSSYNPRIFGKVETPKGAKNIKDFIGKIDSVVIGRGDLVPESDIKYAPIYQDEIIKEVKKYDKDKDIYIGTHILNSMKKGSLPDFSEVDGIYNLIEKGVSGFLLSGETSIGKAPVNTVKYLKELVEFYERRK
ncbi:pyruvate kinase [Clostridium chrysemydis]|uniref:pyruvate kinase n=1 Tax=Clostridium chrysemydis TaxID=2665504 RepID=UPI001883C5EC|nr:pyruvate kinase [Clostridium chrysemydis]